MDQLLAGFSCTTSKDILATVLFVLGFEVFALFLLLYTGWKDWDKPSKGL